MWRYGVNDRLCCLCAEVQHLQEETEHRRALLEQTELEKDSQLARVKAELDSCQARVSPRYHPHTATFKVG